MMIDPSVRCAARPEFEPVLKDYTARRAFSDLEWRIVKHLYAGMDAAWIMDQLACRPHDVTRAWHKALRWADKLTGVMAWV